MAQLQPIAETAATQRWDDALAGEDQAAAARHIAALQLAGLFRWKPEILPAIYGAIAHINHLIGVPLSGDRIDVQFERDARIDPGAAKRGQVVIGEQMSIMFNFQRTSRPNHFIKLALHTRYGPDPVVLVITLDQRVVARLRVDDSFSAACIPEHLERAVLEVVTPELC